jgi:hypothetical protein
MSPNPPQLWMGPLQLCWLQQQFHLYLLHWKLVVHLLQRP